MPSTLLRVAVSLLTFGLGITATTLWIAYRTPDLKNIQGVPHHTHTMPPPPLSTIKVMPPPPSSLDEPPPPPPPLGIVRAPVMGGILNGKAISKPLPVYPSIARAARASGMVIVEVTLDESGRVISAEAVSGHPLLRQATVEAAYEARFAPTRMSGQPVKVSGTISYYFVLQ